MTDKVQKIKECMFTKDYYTDEDRKSLCDGCKEKCKFNKKEYFVNNGIDLGCGVIWKDEEHVSEDLEEEIGKYCSNPENFITYIDVGFKQSPIKKDDIPLIIKAIKFGANWQKEHLTAKGVEGVVHHFGKCEVASVHYNDPTGIPMAYYLSSEGLSAGDKVKIIVIKED